MSKSRSKRAPCPKSMCYVTKKLDTSIAILSSPEDEVVLDALRYLSKFADVQVENLSYLQKNGVLEKLLNLLNRNICVLRLALRLLGVLLTIDDTLVEIEQGLYDDKILQISEMFLSHTDYVVHQLCLSVVSKLVRSKRILSLIFKIDLLYHVLDTSLSTEDPEVLSWNLELFLMLLEVPVALHVLPQLYGLDLSLLLIHMEKINDERMVNLIFKVIYELTRHRIYIFQQMFREGKLVEKMLEVIMSPIDQEHHKLAFDIIINSMKSEETNDYFVETLEFLKFCQWVKTCKEDYLFPSISILEQLTRTPSKRQILFDLSVEQSILSFFRSTEKRVLNKMCEAITNMIAHKYCCEEMLTPAVLKELFRILRKDKEDPFNEAALKTILAFTRRNLKTLNMIYKLGAHKVMLGFFKKNDKLMCEDCFLGIMEILNKLSMHPLYQQDIIGTSFVEKLLTLLQTALPNTAIFASELMFNMADCAEFRRIFLIQNGPKIFVNVLQSSKNIKVLKNILLFVHRILVHEDIMAGFLRKGLIKILKEFPEILKLQMPILDKNLKLIYNQHLSMKFFYTNKLDITDKLQDKFYLIHGHWMSDFPFFEDLETVPLSSVNTIYVVDSSFVLKYEDEYSAVSSISPRKISSERAMSTLTQISSSLSSYLRRKSYQIDYGKLCSDPFLPRYVTNAIKYLAQVDTMEEKIETLARYVDAVFRTPTEGYTKIEKIHTVKLHVEILKHSLGSNLIPVGFLRLGDHCERALLFKAMADKCRIPASLAKGKSKLYWNEVILFDHESGANTVKFYVVDLMTNIGSLLAVGSRAANQYCDITSWEDNLTEWNEKDILL
ncbi:armadillo repeat-containing protein 3-like [Anoplophora glabripennis]|uniref:armadillo repeat-containing protein 3-like n=1 Tax=Anoplophora glabripennis TaxID=217634 RepID=UPI000875540F|nr:armadillo repeat-containing protein 3-like [Anoplophora glabripennis]